jgi:chromosome segregation ATPase
MTINENDQQTHPREHNNFSLEHVDSSTSTGKQLVEELSSKTRELPKVEEDGSSECPFAEALYAQKDESIEKVEKELQELHGYLSLVEQEIARCEGNLQRINADAGSLNLDEAKDKYRVAIRSQESEYNNAVRQRKALIDLIARAEEALALARAKAFPGRKPQKNYRLAPGTFGGWGATDSASRPSNADPGLPSFKDEIDDLISLGPLGKEDS